MTTTRSTSPLVALFTKIIPLPDPDRLVAVGQVGHDSVPFVEQSLEEVGIYSVVQEQRSMTGGQSRFTVLVPASQRQYAEEIVSF